MDILWLVPAAGILSMVFAGIYALNVFRQKAGNKKIVNIARAVQEGANTYLSRQYKTIAIFTVIISAILFLAINPATAYGFALGAFLSALAGYIGMNTSVRANVRTVQATRKGLDKGLKVAFRGGSVTGLSIVGLSLLGIGLFYWIYKDPILIIGFGFGASLISLFARIGGGIYTKAADVGADLVGKIEKNIPEDDPRNPATIADNVGDNVGDCAGMGADLFETYAVTAIAAILLGYIASPLGYPELGMSYPLVLGSIGIIASIIGTFFIRLKGSISLALYKPLIVTVIIAAFGFYFVTDYMGLGLNLFYSTLVGLAIVVFINLISDLYTSTNRKPVRIISESSQTGGATNIITGLAVGLQSTILPVLIIVIGMLLSYSFAGLYGIAVAAMAMLSTAGIIVALDSYGPITDNAGGLAEMADMPKNIRKLTDQLDATGNTTKATTKGYAIGSAGLAALALFAGYTQEISKSLVLEISQPIILAGLFFGALTPFLFSSLCISAVGRSAFKVVNEVRRQFEDKRILQGKKKPDYSKCVDIATKAGLKEMSLPASLAVLSPLVVGFLFGPSALGAMLLGVIISGLFLALMMTIGGGAWDNAKKLIEDGMYGGKGSQAHKAAVIGDTVGDPLKDTAGPAINPLIKAMNTVAIIFAVLVVNYSIYLFS